MKFTMLVLVAGGTMFAGTRTVVPFNRFGTPSPCVNDGNCVVRNGRDADRRDFIRVRRDDRDHRAQDDRARDFRR